MKISLIQLLIIGCLVGGIHQGMAEGAGQAAQLPDNIKLIIGQTDVWEYLPRLKAIEVLSAELPDDQIEALLAFLRAPADTQPEPQLPVIEFHCLKNDVFIALMKQRTKRSLGGELVAMFNNPAMDITWRDYCLQFIAQWYLQEPDVEVRQQMFDTLYQALRENETTIAGTAVNSLYLIYSRTRLERDKLMDAVDRLLIDLSTSDATKISAIQVAGKLNTAQALPGARAIVSMPGEHDMILVMSAVAALGEVGTSADLRLLETYLKSSDGRKRIPAAAAIQKIKNRCNNLPAS